MKPSVILLFSVLLMCSGGCGTRDTVKVEEFSGRVGVSVSRKNFTVLDMREAIIKGCVDARWIATDADADVMEAEFNARNKRAAIVIISYTATEYSIVDKDSANKRAYKLIRRLNEAIQKQILLKQGSM